MNWLQFVRSRCTTFLFTFKLPGLPEPWFKEGFRLGVLMLAALGSLLMFPRAFLGVTRFVLSASFRGFRGLALFCFRPKALSPWFSLLRLPSALRGVTKFSSSPFPDFTPWKIFSLEKWMGIAFIHFSLEILLFWFGKLCWCWTGVCLHFWLMCWLKYSPWFA